MRIFVSFSFRPENAWIEDYVIPLIRCFGHEPVTGRLLEGGPLPDEVHKLMKSCRRVICFVTRAKPEYGTDGRIVSYAPPDWVRDEMMKARGASVDTIEFRESGVAYGGAAPFSAWNDFDRDQLPRLLLRVAELLKNWPVGPLQLRLTVPLDIQEDFSQGVASGNIQVGCVARDGGDNLISDERLQVRIRDGQFVVPFWIKPDPDLAIDLEMQYGSRKLVCRGVSPAICIAPLRAVP